MKKIAMLMVTILSGVSAWAGDPLASGFVNPPAAARPWVFWYWMDGHIDRDGITKDLEAMARNGIGGVVLGDICEKQDKDSVKFLSSEWQELFAHTLREAKRVGIVVSTCPGAGWSALGGPWIKPEDSMQVLVWSATHASGPQPFVAKLPHPQVVENYYRDVAVLAFPAVAEPLMELKDITTIPAVENAAQLVDGDPQTSVALKGGAKDPRPVIDLQFKKPVKIRGLAIEFVDFPRLGKLHVEATDMNGRFTTVGIYSDKLHGSDGKVVRSEIVINETTTDHLRIVLSENPGAYALKIADIYVFSDNYIPNWVAKSEAHVAVRVTAGDDASPRARRMARSAKASQGIAPDSIIDLTKKMSADGRLDWDVPAGSWTILRFGHTSRAATNRPAKDGEGLETDKFRRDVTKFQFDQYLGKMVAKHREFMGSTFVAMWQDSWETGCQNWSPVFRDEFKRRRGYDLLPYLPAMTGRTVGSGALGERFLWDVRRTIADLAADNYMGMLTELGKPYGIGLWFQPINRHFMDGMQAVGRATGVEANMFMDNRDKKKKEYPREKFCASAAHGYGQIVVHSEAATAPPPSGDFGVTPANIRELVNANFCTGVNNHWIHVYLHQSWQRAQPGLSWRWGLQFNRNNTWFEKLGGWSDYVTRGQYMLRQGVPVVDVACFIGEAVPTEAGNMGCVEELDKLPAGIDYDVCNAEIVLTRMSVKDGRIVLPDGMSYALLYLPEKAKIIRPEILRKIRDMVSAGATLIGARPVSSPSLENYPACDAEVKQLADELWGRGADAATGHRVGSGMVYSAEALNKALAVRNVGEDFSFTSTKSEANIEYYHRQTADTDIYFVANRLPRAEEALCTFRVDGRTPELWQPDTGSMEPAGAYDVKDGHTKLPLRFDPSSAFFVVFRKPANTPNAHGKNWPEFTPVQEIAGSWEINFDPKRGGPAKAATFEKLDDWSKNAELGIRYYSGTAVYRKTFEISQAALPKAPSKIFLDLGDVRDVASVTFNGKNLGILWKTPYRIDITEAGQAGANSLVIEVVNTWVNRMIGDARMYPDDAQWEPESMAAWKGFKMKEKPDWFAAWDTGRGPRPTGRVAFCTEKFYSAKDPLMPAGLIGPVRILTTTETR